MLFYLNFEIRSLFFFIAHYDYGTFFSYQISATTYNGDGGDLGQNTGWCFQFI
jgi:hypothetical protein